MINVKELSKQYRISKKQKFLALNRVSFEIEDQNIVAIIGESGSGKSTLMNLISTIDNSSGGFVEYNGNKVSFLKENKKADFRKENVGFIFQSFNLLNDLTVLDNVAIVMEIAGVDKESRYKRAEELLILVGLKEHLMKKPGYLSGGQKQRVAIARALANEPELILADEPTGSLDSSTSKDIMNLLCSIAKSGTKILVVTHDMKVANYCERIIKMHDGSIISDELNTATESEKIDVPIANTEKKGGLKLSGIIKLSSSSFKRHLRKNIIISLGVSIAIASIITSVITKDSLSGYFDKLYSQSGGENVILVYSGSMDFSLEPKDADVFEILKLDDVDGIEKYDSLPEYNLTFSNVIDSENMKLNVNITYPEGYQTFGDADIVSGSKPVDQKEIVISEDLVQKYGFTNDSIIGEKLNLRIEVVPPVDYSTMPVEGDSEVVNVEGAEDESVEIEINNPNVVDPNLDESAVYSELEIKEEEFIVSGVLSTSGIRSNKNTVYFTDEYASEYGTSNDPFINTVIVAAEDGKANDVVEIINSNQQEYSSENWFAFAIRDLQEVFFIELILSVTFTIFTVILGVSVLVAAIMIAVMSYVSILERIREVGVLRAIGAKRKDIRRMFYTESFAIGVISGTFAIILGFALSAILVNIANRKVDFSSFGTDLDLYVNPIKLIVIFILTILLAIFSSFISINKGLKIQPVDALKKR